MHFHFRYSIVSFVLLFFSACHHKAVVSSVTESHYTINKNEIDSSIYKYVAPYKQQMEKEMNTVIAHTDAPFPKSGEAESALGNFTADAVFFESKKIMGADSVNADVVILNKGGLRNSIPKGDITIGNMFELMPFENELVILKLSAAQFNDMVKKIAEKGGLPLAGMRMNISQGKPENVMVHGATYDPQKAYTVITSDYLANGGDSYTFFSNPLERKKLELKLRDALISYCKDMTTMGRTLKPYTDGRIQLSK